MPEFESGNSTRRDFVRVVGSLPFVAACFHAGYAATAPVKIATIGSGKMGGGLGTLWLKAGHQVMFSSRHPEELKGLVDSLGPAARAGTVQDAVAFGDVVILAVPYSAMPQIAADFGHALAAKRLLIDVSNPFPERDGEVGVKAREEGAGLFLARLIPGARIVRAFNAISHARLADDARRAGDRVGVPMAGDDPKALTLASDLVREIGFEPVVIGPLAAGKHLVPGTPLSGEHSAKEIREIAATLK